MRDAPLITRVLALCFGLLVPLAPLVQAQPAATPSEPRLETGDIVLTGNDSAWAFLARRFADRDSRWSHVGIVVRDQTGLSVVHMDGSPLGGHIRREPLSSFTESARYSRFVRPSLDRQQRRRLRSWLDGHLVRQTAFDTRFRLDERPAMYCSELVWRGLDRVGGLPASRALPTVAGRPFVPVDRLIELDVAGRSASAR
ncbi:MAG: hypothetical protein ABR561_00395 [Guyparkeria sp.]